MEKKSIGRILTPTSRCTKKTKAKGGDKSLVFEDWSNPTRDDRNLIYFKGAYVSHLLLRDQSFWVGIKKYSQQYFGKPVTTHGFQKAMEELANRSLSQFFDQWVY